MRCPVCKDTLVKVEQERGICILCDPRTVPEELGEALREQGHESCLDLGCVRCGRTANEHYRALHAYVRIPDLVDA